MAQTCFDTADEVDERQAVFDVCRLNFGSAVLNKFTDIRRRAIRDVPPDAIASIIVVGVARL